MATVLLLLISNTFMTFAWYGHLKHRSAPLWEAIVVSWLITLAVFFVFAYFYLGEPIRWNYAASLVCIMGALMFAFWGRV